MSRDDLPDDLDDTDLIRRWLDGAEIEDVDELILAVLDELDRRRLGVDD